MESLLAFLKKPPYNFSFTCSTHNREKVKIENLGEYLTIDSNMKSLFVKIEFKMMFGTWRIKNKFVICFSTI